MLSASRLSMRFATRPVLRDLSFGVPNGAVFAVTGQNGSGKSTLLKIVAGLLAPSRGEIRWNNATTRGHCAYFAPDAPVYAELTALENLRFFAPNATDENLKTHLTRWNLEKRADDFAGDLSSGLRARLQLCVADWFAAPILLLDEPSAHLDEAGRELVKNLLLQQRTRGVALLATNDPRDLEGCDGRIEV